MKKRDIKNGFATLSVWGMWGILFIWGVGGGMLAAQRGIEGPAAFFPKEKAKVLLVGTFHFDYPDLDAHVTATQDRVDVLSPDRQREVRQLVAYIKRFRPNKIALEATEKWNATGKLRDYAAGRLELERDERHQIGLRLAAELGLDTLYSIDTKSLAQELEVRDPALMDSLFQDYDFESQDTLATCTEKWLAAEDQQKKASKLLAYFKHINSRESHRYGYGIYLIGDFELDEHRGADVLSVWWYNRNLRIFRRIQSLSQDPGDRILVLIGNGHAALLRQLFECSPEFEWVEFGDL